MSSPSGFAHRDKDYETFDSICRACFATVAAHLREKDLEKYERVHVCESWRPKRLHANVAGRRSSILYND